MENSVAVGNVPFAPEVEVPCGTREAPEGSIALAVSRSADEEVVHAVVKTIFEGLVEQTAKVSFEEVNPEAEVVKPEGLGETQNSVAEDVPLAAEADDPAEDGDQEMEDAEEHSDIGKGCEGGLLAHHPVKLVFC